MSIERIGIEKALPLLILGAGCLSVTAVVFGILCGHMIRERRKLEMMISQSRNSIRYPALTTSDRIRNANQSAAILPSTFDPVFKIHPHVSVKRIIEL